MAEVNLTKKELNIPRSAIVVVLAVIVLIAVIFIGSFSKSTQVTCTTQACFDKQYITCQPTIWKFADAKNYPAQQGYYKINGKVGNRCSVTSYNSYVSNYKLTCDLHYGVSFSQAQKELYNNPKGFNCRRS